MFRYGRDAGATVSKLEPSHEKDHAQHQHREKGGDTYDDQQLIAARVKHVGIPNSRLSNSDA